MKALTLQNVSNDLYNWLKQQAEVNHHSINDEVICLLEDFRDKTTNKTELTSNEKFVAIMEISHRCSVLPQLEKRNSDAIIGYDQNGIPT